MSLDTFVKGTTVKFTTTFLDSDGNTLTVTGATIRLNYEVDGDEVTQSFPMVDDTGDSWTYEWDTGAADVDKGIVSYHMESAGGSQESAAQGKFKILANDAAP